MRILIDLDGTICEIRKDGQTYSEVKANSGAVEKLKALKDAGHYIILQTARHMKTMEGDVEKVKEKIGQITLDWLKQNQIPYDELHFGKPYAHVYIDDLGETFTSWDNFFVENYEDEKVNILIPMAGRGSRFFDAGYTELKPFIEAGGKTLVEWAVKSFDFLDKVPDHRFIFIVHQEHIEKYDAERRLKKIFGPDTLVIPQNVPAIGQAHSVLLAKKYIDNFQKLFIYNCDTYATSKIWELIEQEDPDGIIECFIATEPRFSFAKNNALGYVEEVAEKKAISNLASTGLYYFKRGRDFVAAAENLIKNEHRINGEFYVMPCYTELINAGKKIKTIPTDEQWVFGTPAELENFKSNYISKHGK